MNAMAGFRTEARAWVEENLPPGLRGAGTVFNGGRKTPTITPDALRWAEVCYERGYTAPTWPKEYGGAGMTADEQTGTPQKRCSPRTHRYRSAATASP